MGSTELTFFEKPEKFQVLMEIDSFPTDGIIGMEFLVNEKAEISFHHNTLVTSSQPIKPIPFETVEKVLYDASTDPMYEDDDEDSIKFVLRARSRMKVPIPIRKTDLKTGYLPRIKSPDYIFMGNSIVTNDNGRAYIYAINSYEDDAEIEVPPQQIYEYYDTSEDFFEQDSEGDIVISDKTRDERIIESLRLDHLNSEERDHVNELIKEFPDLFHLPGDKLPATTEIKHTIPTTDDLPITVRQYRYPQFHKDEINNQIQKLLNDEIIVDSASPYNSPLWIVPKKPDSKGNKRWRMVIDFRALNEKTISDAYPLPNITEILDRLGNAKYFSIFDLASGFHQIEMDPKDRQKTAFSTPNGHYEYKRMPFGLKNAPATFQRLMDRVLLGLQDSELFVYLDDIVVFASSLQEHGTRMRRLFKRLEKSKLSLQPDKCEFLNTEVIYLGHIISNDGVRPDPKKTEAVDKFPVPKNVTNIRQFLGLAGYYRRFIENFSGKAKPLTNLLKKGIVFNWTQEQQESFDYLKKALCTYPILQYPDFTKPFILTTDASDQAVGAVLSQGKIGEDQPIAYFSKVLNPAEKNYGTTEKECLAVVYGILHFRPYLYGRHFTLVSDHEPLKWIDSVKLPIQRLIRWRIRLREYEYTFIHKPGRLNLNADALSRNPIVTDTKLLGISSERKKEPPKTIPRNVASLRKPNVQGRTIATRANPLPTVLEESATIGERLRVRKEMSKPPTVNKAAQPIRARAAVQRVPKLTITSDPDAPRPVARGRYSAFPSQAPRQQPLRGKPTRVTRAPAREPITDTMKLVFLEPDQTLGEEPTDPEEITKPDTNKSIVDISTQASTSRRSDPYWWDNPPSNIKTPEKIVDSRDSECSPDDYETQKTNEFGITFRHPIGRSTPAIPTNQNLSDEETETETETEVELKQKSPFDTVYNQNTASESEEDVPLPVQTIAPRKVSSTIPDELFYPNMGKDEIKVKINTTNENLTYRKGNFLHFISADCEFTTAISRLLIETEYICPQELKFQKPKRTQVLLKNKNNQITLSAVLKSHHFDAVSIQEVKDVLRTVKEAIKTYQIKTLKVSRPGDMLEHFSYSFIIDLFKEALRECDCEITICQGNTVIPPEEARNEIITEYHDSLIGGHKGITKTYRRIRERFYWPNLKEEVTEYIKKCTECQEQKLSRIKTREPMIITDTPAEPFDKISIDTVGPLPKTPDGNQHILTIQDNLTKYCIAAPIPDIRAETIADALARNVIIHFGTPRIILSDQGRSFVGKVFHHLAMLFRIKHMTTSGYHPQTNGSLERSHIVLTEFIKHYVDRYEDWDKLIPFAMFSYNTSVHESTNFTPFELIFGRRARIPSSFPPAEKTETYGDYLCELTTRLDEMRDLATNSLIKSKYRSKRYYDKKAKTIEFNPGDPVYAIKEPRKGKFDTHYTGPYQIVETLDKHNAVLQTREGKRFLKHLDKLKHAVV